jgi:beta-glucosidase
LERRHLQRCAKNILTMLMKSPVMERSLGRTSQEELDAAREMAEEDQVDFDLEFFTATEGHLTLDPSKVSTDKGSSFVYGITAEPNGFYTLHLKVRAEGGDLAQVNASIFVDEHLIEVLTLTGADKDWVEKDIDLMFFGPNHYLKFYFAQSGMEIQEISLTFKEEVKPFA